MFRRRAFDELLTAKFADGIIGNSPEICSSIVSSYNYPTVQTCVIPGEIEIRHYHRKENKPQILARLGLNATSRLLLSVGSVQGRKELDVILLALHHLCCTTDVDLHLAICGQVESLAHSQLEGLATERGINNRVHFLGYNTPEQLAEYFSAADCFIHPGRWEGSPRVVKEALAYGCGVIASDISGIKNSGPSRPVHQIFCTWKAFGASATDHRIS